MEFGEGDELSMAQRYAQQAQLEAQQQAQDYDFHRSYSPGSMPDSEYDEEMEEPSTRGEAWSDLLACLTSPLLRMGFLIQLLVLIFGFALYYGHGGKGVFTFDLYSTPERVRTSQGYNLILILLESLFLVGCIFVSGFQIYVADNSKTTRGFRAGSKLLSTATMLDTFVIGLRLMQYIYAYQFLSVRWWMKYTQGNADWCIFYSGALLHSLALQLYGLAIFYMEAYHDEGTFEEWSWLILTLFTLAAFFEFLLVFTGFGAFYTVFELLALLAAVIWSFSFEPLLHYYSPVFHDRDLNADIPVIDEDEAERLYRSASGATVATTIK